jgi:Spy/CpxP family protein refolding chaperone
MRDWILLLVAIAGLAGFAFVIGLRTAQRAEPTSLADLLDVNWLEDRLRLSTAQAGQLKAITDEYTTPLSELRTRHVTARRTLADQLFTPDPTPQGRRALLDEMGQTRTEIDALMLTAIARIRETLTPPQQERLDRHLRRIVASGP